MLPSSLLMRPPEEFVTRLTFIWSSPWWGRRSPRGCSSICKRPLWKRVSTRRGYGASRIGRNRGMFLPIWSPGSSSWPAPRRFIVHGYRDIKYAADAAQALRPLAGRLRLHSCLPWDLFNASLFAASILPLSTAYTVCEGLGFESGVDKKFSEAPVFYWLYTVLLMRRAGR